MKFFAKLYTTPPLYYWGLILIAFALPLSEWLMSTSQFLIASFWILGGNFKQKWSLAKSNKVLLFFVAVWLIHAIGLLWTYDLKFGINDLRVKLPLLLLPIFAGTLPRLTNQQVKSILLSFIAAVLLGTLISMTIYLGLTHHEVKDIRDISIFISHIRFSLLINVAIVILVYFLRSETIFKIAPTEKKIYLPILLWLIAFLFILGSFTGIVVFMAIVLALVILLGIKYLGKIKRFAFFSSFAIFCIAGLVYIASIASSFYTTKDIDVSKLDLFSKNGNWYTHNPKIKFLENGNYISLYVCESELMTEWNKRSKIKITGKDKNGHPIKYTLIRYLTSKGLRKDAEGISQLTNEDIQKIEHSNSNYKYFGGGFSTKIYQFIWQIDCYIKGGNPSGHTLTQRMEYLKAAMNILKNNFWIGVGTGDLNQEFLHQYIVQESVISYDFRLRAHNQFVTFFITFGLFGFVAIMFLLIAPAFISKATNYFIFNLFALTAILSMLNEDTLESQPGITYVVFFYVLFTFVIQKQQEKKQIENNRKNAKAQSLMMF